MFKKVKTYMYTISNIKVSVHKSMNKNFHYFKEN